MNKKNVALAIIMGLTIAKGVFAADPETEKEELDINTITYIQEESEIELGFDVNDYLPEGFDPYKIYVDLAAISYIEDESIDNIDFSKHLPDGFDAYAYPTDIQSINYIDENDDITLDFDNKKYLPKGFDAYKK